MVRTDTLKNFVKMHENKLNAKLEGLRAQQLDNELHHDTTDDTAYGPADAAQHWALNETDRSSRRRPQSHYFNFILTATH